MGRLRFGSLAWIVVAISLFLFLPACGGRKPQGASPFPATITLNPGISFSMQVGTVIQLTAVARNANNSSLSPTFTFQSSNSGILDIAPNGGACAGSWNAPLYSVCTPAATGQVQVTASALGATSPPTQFFVHGPIDDIQVSVLPPVNSPPPACPGQTALPAACNIQFNNNVAKDNVCLSQNQVQTLQAKAFSHGADVTATIGPFAWSEVSPSVAKVTPIVDLSQTVATNQISVSPETPGQTQIIASASGLSSQPYYFEACPVQCIALELGVNGTQRGNETSFVLDKGTSETITATAVDVQGCIVPKPPLTWVSSAPGALSAGGSTGCAAGTTCAITTSEPGVASITASCSPPTCNVGFPLNPAGLSPPFVPEPVYPITAISGLVTGATAATSVLVTSRDCSTDPLCGVALYNVSTSSNLPGNALQIPTPPNSLMLDAAGDKGYMGSEFGAVAITTANIGGTTSPFTFVPAPGTPLGVAIGKIIAVSPNGSQAIFSDTVSTPNQVYAVTSASSSTPLNINGATAAAFSPDELKAFILGNGGNTLYAYSVMQSLQAPVTLPAPATSVVFNSTGSFALLAGGNSPGNLAAYNTCDNTAVTPPLSAGALTSPPLLLKMIPGGNVPMGTTFVPTLQTAGLDFFFGVDNTGIDIIATTSSLVPLPLTSGPVTPPAGCTRPIVLAQTAPPPPAPPATFAPIHINIGQGNFTPISFFLSPDSTRVYIVTSDLGVLIYNFNTLSTSKIALINGATPLAADMTVDGTLIYVAASDGLLHVLNTSLGIDQTPSITFSPLPNSSNSFCFTGTNCAPNIVAVKQ